jgi:DNA-binding response OmpR family regulator
MAQIRVAGQRLTGRRFAPAHESTSERESAAKRLCERWYRGAMSDARRILIADDEPAVRDTLVGFFKTAYKDCEIEAVADGAAAVAAVRRETPTLVLLDIEMPGLDGVAALRQIRALAARVPVIMVTGNESSRVAGDVIGLGAFSYLPKPVRFEYLHHIVAAILERGP